MRAITWLALGAVLAGCPDPVVVDTGDPDTDPGLDTDDTEDTDSGDTDTDTDTDSGDTDTDTAIATGNEGSVALIHWPRDAEWPESSFLAGWFTDSNQGLWNAADCALGASPCIDALPTGDDAYVDLDPALAFDYTASTFYNVGNLIRLGAFEADYVYDGSLGVSYNAGEGGDWPSGESLGLHLDGAWGRYDGTADVVAASAMVATSPDPLSEVYVVSDDVVPFRWEAGGPGEVYLLVMADGLSRLWHLTDDGSFDLDVASLALDPAVTDVSVFLQRATTQEIDVNGNTILANARSEQWYYLVVTNVADRVKADGGDDCASAPTLAPGAYYGRLGGADDLDPKGAGCVTTDAPGLERVVKVEVPAGHLLTADYELPSGTAVAYLVTDCADLAGSCLTADHAAYAGDQANLSWYNESDTTVTAALVLDAEETDGFFFLDLETRAANPVAPADTCKDVDASAPITAGTWYGDLTGRGADYDGKCSSWYSAKGDDAFVPVHLEDGQRLKARLTVPNGDALVYVVTDCSDASGASCLSVGDDNATGEAERISYVNKSGSAQDLVLVIDTTSGTGPFWLDVAIDVVNAVVVADTCGDAKLLSPLPAGSYMGSVKGFANDLDPTSSGCTGWSAAGEDGLVPVELAAGQTMTARLVGEYDASLYLVTDCSDAATCVVGADEIFGSGEPEVFEWRNTGGSTQLYYLVVDGFSSQGDFELDLEIE